MSLSVINVIASIQTGISHIKVDVDNIFTYLETLATHTVSSLLLTPFYPKGNAKECLKRHGPTPLASLTQWSRCRHMELLQIIPNNSHCLWQSFSCYNASIIGW